MGHSGRQFGEETDDMLGRTLKELSKSARVAVAACSRANPQGELRSVAGAASQTVRFYADDSNDFVLGVLKNDLQKYKTFTDECKVSRNLFLFLP